MCFREVKGGCPEILDIRCGKLPSGQVRMSRQVASLKSLGFPVRIAGRQRGLATIEGMTLRTKNRKSLRPRNGQQCSSCLVVYFPGPDNADQREASER